MGIAGDGRVSWGNWYILGGTAEPCGMAGRDILGDWDICSNDRT